MTTTDQASSDTSVGDVEQEVLDDIAAELSEAGADDAPSPYLDQPNGDPDAPAELPDDDGGGPAAPGPRRDGGHHGYVSPGDGVRWTPFQAVNYALDQVDAPDRDYSGMCDHFTGRVYGYLASGWYDAKLHAQALDRKGWIHRGDAPRGALGYWKVGKHGHTAVCVGRDRWASTDIRRRGKVDVVRLSAFGDRWNATFIGWASPYFPRHGGRNPADAGSEWPVKEPVVTLSALLSAARRDPGARQGATTDGAADDVTIVERALVSRGLLGRDLADGSWGTATLRAYGKWQRHLGYSGDAADGAPGLRSLKRLGAWAGFAVQE